MDTDPKPTNWWTIALIVGAAGVLLFLATQDGGGCPDGRCPPPRPVQPLCPGPYCPNNPTPRPTPRPTPKPAPRPAPRPDPDEPYHPRPKPRPWGDDVPPVGGFDAAGRGRAVVGGRTHDGEELSADLPGAEHIKNIGSRVNGLGMCTQSSIEMAALWQGLECMRGFRDWCANRPEGGGGFPTKIDRQVKAFCAAKGIEVPEYVQYEGANPEPILELIDKTRRMACITYGQGERYQMQRIAHMVCCPKYSGRFGVVLDNNFPGDGNYEWVDAKAELVRRIKYPSGRAWVFVWLTPAPPPSPSSG